MKEGVSTQEDYETIISEYKRIDYVEKGKLLSKLKALRIIRFALPPDTFCLVSSLKSANKIWDRLKELY